MEDVIRTVDRLINSRGLQWGLHVYSERLDRHIVFSELPALEDKVVQWSKEHPLIWNTGIGPAASFVPTLTRLLLERTKDIYGPYDHIVHVRLPSPSAATACSAGDHEYQLAFEVATAVLETRLPEDIKQLAAEESYFGYSKLSDNLMLQAFGKMYYYMFGSNRRSIMTGPAYDRQPHSSPIIERIREALEEKRHLLLVENLHVPISLDMLVFLSGYQRPSALNNRRWLISTTSNDVYEKSRDATRHDDTSGLHLTREYHYALPKGLQYRRQWAVLISEALRDAARSIYMALQDKGYTLEFWLHLAQQCLYYAVLYHPLQGEGRAAGRQGTSSVAPDELVRCWVAEDLLFSEAISTGTPVANSPKQSEYYRSAYEAGRVVIQALQQYSLLPIYSVSSTTESTSSPQDVITGLSLLSNGVLLGLKKDKLNADVRRNQLRWVSFMNDDGRHVSWDWWPREKREDSVMTTLILRGCSNLSEFSFEKLFTQHLRVLDLSYTPINSLPPSFSQLLNLYMLSLRGCTQLKSLSDCDPQPSADKETSVLAYLENLGVLDMNGIPLLELTQQDGSNKSNLHYLDLSGSKFTNLPSEFFCEMSSLQELILGNCTNLRELPPSMAQLSNLLILHVEGTQISYIPEHMFQKMQSLHTLRLINNLLLMSLPVSQSQANALKQLHLCNCVGLSLEFLWEQVPCLEDIYIQTWKSMEDIKILGHPNLRTFSLSGPWVRCLSLHGCSKLKSVNFNDDLTALEIVDLSRTAIDEVPHNLPNLPQLNMLLLLGVPYFMRFPWHQLVRFPKVFYLDHFANDDNQIPKIFGHQRTCGDEHQHEEKTTNTAQVKINDPRMFHSFNEEAANKLGQFLQSFNLQVRPCSDRGKGPQNNEVEQCARIRVLSAYRDVQYLEASSIMPMMKLLPKQRHIEISAVNRYPNGLRHILSVTNSILIKDDAFVRCLTDLNYNLNELEECQLQRCHQMTVVFLIRSRGSEALPHLQILQVFNLNNLLSVVEPSDLSRCYFITLKLLKHIQLEHCPRLEKMFPCSLSLPALETLVILFCSNLKTIFYKQGEYQVAPSPLPNIKRIYLQELPQLQHIHDDIKFEFEAPTGRCSLSGDANPFNVSHS